MPITINDCKVHNLMPTVDTPSYTVIYCLQCELMDESYDLYASGTGFMDVVDRWNRMNPKEEENNANNDK